MSKVEQRSGMPGSVRAVESPEPLHNPYPTRLDKASRIATMRGKVVIATPNGIRWEYTLRNDPREVKR